MHSWQHWSEGEIFDEVSGIEPQLASWDKSTHPAQIRLRSYLDDLLSRLKPLPANETPLSLHLNVDVRRPERLLHHYDLENYLTPLFGTGRLNPRRFAYVSARKRVGGGSMLRLGLAKPTEANGPTGKWGHCACTLTASAATRVWKENLRTALAATAQRLPPGPAEVRMTWRCSPNRNWVNLWKPTGDAMGPILGEPDSRTPFRPNDDRITTLCMHLNPDLSFGHAVSVGLWWRGAYGD